MSSTLEATKTRWMAFLDTYLTAGNITKDDDETLGAYHIAWGFPPYPMIKVFNSTGANKDLVYLLEDPSTSTELNADKTVDYYDEVTPVSLYAIDKPGVTGSKMVWKGERELRRILDASPFGSVRVLTERHAEHTHIGSLTVWKTTLVCSYRREPT